MSNKNQSITKKLTESALLIAVAVILSFVKLLNLPYGGSITACSMLPIIIIAYRYGTPWGLLSAFAYSVIQLLVDINVLSYATSWVAVVAIIALDYILAFTFIGFSGIFRKLCKNQFSGIPAAAVCVCVLRYICHVISGCTVWAGLSIPTNQAFIYSLAYNATYMVPETLITIIGAIYLSRAVDFTTPSLQRIHKGVLPVSHTVTSVIGNAAFAGVFIADIVLFAAHIQNAETGDFDITGINNVNYTAIIIITVCGLAVFAISKVIASNIKKKAEKIN